MQRNGYKLSEKPAFVVGSIQLNAAATERVSNYKLLQMIISQFLTWNKVAKKALKRLFAWHSFEKAGLKLSGFSASLL